ncbi:hypothetical protein [Streptomyces sp. NPDC059092]
MCSVFALRAGDTHGLANRSLALGLFALRLNVLLREVPVKAAPSA